MGETFRAFEKNRQSGMSIEVIGVTRSTVDPDIIDMLKLVLHDGSFNIPRLIENSI